MIEPVVIRVKGMAPVSQGSKNPWGGEVTAKTLKPWRKAVREAADEAMQGRYLIDGACAVYMRFTMPRPAGHYGTGRNLGKLKARFYSFFHIKKPDLDKLARAIGDSLSGVVYGDDCQVYRIVAEKHYCNDDNEGVGVHVLIWEV